MTGDPASRVTLIDEPTYSFGSADNIRRYDTEVDLTGGYTPSSIHGVIVDGRPTMVIGDAGGTSRVHDHSVLIDGDHVYVVVGAHVVKFTLGNPQPDWTLKTDGATCFGIYRDRGHDALISHGELEIARFSRDGDIIWSAGEADIFSEGFALLDDCIETIDFDGRQYHFDYATGKPTRHNKASHHNPLPAPSRFSLVTTTLNLSRSLAPGSGCVDFDVDMAEDLSSGRSSFLA